MGAPPSVQNPGGLSAAYSQASAAYDAAVQALEQLGGILKFIDSSEAAQVQMMEAKLTTMKAKRMQALQSAMSTLQANTGGPPQSPVLGG